MGWKKWLAVILGALGLFYLVVPHDLQSSLPLGLGLPHILHQVIGIVLIVLALYAALKSR
jgi:drug/metabolite transporter (DMT)-like permease